MKFAAIAETPKDLEQYQGPQYIKIIVDYLVDESTSDKIILLKDNEGKDIPIRVNFLKLLTSNGCHTKALTGVFTYTKEHVSLEQIPCVKAQLGRALFDHVRRYYLNGCHVFLSDNNEVSYWDLYRVGLLNTAPDNRKKAFSDEPLNTSGGWRKNMLLSGTGDFIKYLMENCAADPATFGKVYTTDFTVNPNYDRGACRSCIWVVPGRSTQPSPAAFTGILSP